MFNFTLITSFITLIIYHINNVKSNKIKILSAIWQIFGNFLQFDINLAKGIDISVIMCYSFVTY